MAEVLAEGYNVFGTSKSPSGTVKYLATPADVIALIQSGKLQEHILLVRGGTIRSSTWPARGRRG